MWTPELVPPLSSNRRHLWPVIAFAGVAGRVSQFDVDGVGGSVGDESQLRVSSHSLSESGPSQDTPLPDPLPSNIGQLKITP